MIHSPEEFVRLRTSPDPAEYRRAALEPAEHAVWLDVLKRFPEMRFWVAQNKTVPHGILELLAADADPKVRGMVARKRKATPELLSVLAGDLDESIRFAVASNPSATEPVLRRLLQDSWSEVVRVAEERLRTGSHK